MLVCCTSCARHVKVSETACPFCGARRVISRAALVVMGAAAIAACAKEPAGVIALYGGPPVEVDAGTSVTVTPPDAAPAAPDRAK